MSTTGTERKLEIDSQLLSFVEENDRNPLLGTLFLALVTKLAPWSIGPCALLLGWCEFSLLPLAS